MHIATCRFAVGDSSESGSWKGKYRALGRADRLIYVQICISPLLALKRGISLTPGLQLEFQPQAEIQRARVNFLLTLNALQGCWNRMIVAQIMAARSFFRKCSGQGNSLRNEPAGVQPI